MSDNVPKTGDSDNRLLRKVATALNEGSFAGVAGPDGAPGPDGSAGSDGSNGTNGAPGANGTNGTNGTNGAPGANGTNGTNGTDGAAGSNGAPGSDGAAGAPAPGRIETLTDVLPTPLIWFKASSLVLNNNDPVASWTNEGSVGGNWVQATANNKPTYITNALGIQSAVRFRYANPNHKYLDAGAAVTLLHNTTGTLPKNATIILVICALAQSQVLGLAGASGVADRLTINGVGALNNYSLNYYLQSSAYSAPSWCETRFGDFAMIGITRKAFQDVVYEGPGLVRGRVGDTFGFLPQRMGYSGAVSINENFDLCELMAWSLDLDESAMRQIFYGYIRGKFPSVKGGNGV